MSAQRLETAYKFVEHFAKLDSNILHSILADDYMHQYAPSSLPQLQPFSKDGLIQFVDQLRLVANGYPMLVKQVLDSASSNAVTVWTVGDIDFRDEVKDEKEEWKCRGEYVFLIFMDETGDKITKTIEFVDSHTVTGKLVPIIKKAHVNLTEKVDGH